MSIRRSTRLASNAIRSNVTEVEQVVKESKPRKRSNAAEKNNGAKKRRNDSDTVQAPENWEIVYDKIKEYRQKTIAPVDTMGCERLAEDGIPDKESRFQTLISLMLSSQTKDTVTSAAVKKLQAELPGGLNLDSILKVDEKELDEYIKPVGFHTRKAKYIKDTAVILRDKFDGDIPNTIEGLVSLPGVGPKMGYLALQCAWKLNAGIGVDVHVHRITNRLGWCDTAKKLPEDTRKQLESWLPKDRWREINPMLVGFGQVTCLPQRPKCSECPVSEYCPSAVKTTKKVKVKKGTVVKTEDFVQDNGGVVPELKDGSTMVIKEEQEATESTAAFSGGHEPEPPSEAQSNPLEW